MIPAGERWHQILIAQPTETQDSRGVPQPSYSAFATASASYQETASQENVVAGQPFAMDTAKWGLLPIPGITPKMLINEGGSIVGGAIVGGVTHDIMQVDYTKQRQGELWITTKRRGI